MILSNSNLDYILYPNEPIDKLTVNRVLERLYYQIGTASAVGSIVVANATDSSYGIIKRSSMTEYMFRLPNDSDKIYDYYNKTLNINQLNDFAGNQYSFYELYDIQTLQSEDNSSKQTAIRTSIGDCTFITMPNGVKMSLLSFDIGISDLFGIFSSSVSSGSFDAPITINGYNYTLPWDSVSKNAVDTVYTESITAHPLSSVFGSVSGNPLSSTYISDTTVSLHHHNCNWMSYSSFRQSCVELTYTLDFGLNSLYDAYYSLYHRTNRGSSPSQNIISEFNTASYPKDVELFNIKPIIIPQLTFYNNESCPKVRVGTYSEDAEGGEIVTFLRRNEINNAKLNSNSSEYAVKDDISYELPKSNGSVTVRSFDISIGKTGTPRENTISMDLSFKFTAGGTDDPDRELSIRNMSEKARLQILMIGI